MKKCKPGTICLETGTLLLIVFLMIIISFYLMKNFNQKIVFNNNNNPSEKNLMENKNSYGNNIPLFPNYPYSNLPGDVLLNPYMPPLSNDRYLVPNINLLPINSMPINISTNVGAVNTNYRQIGILTSQNNKGKILPLLGRPLFTNRDKWQYYTMSDQNNSVKLPISQNGKSCTNEYGCNRLYNGDTVYVEGINQPYIVTIYDNDTIQYLPF
jgi:hypothetical protein